MARRIYLDHAATTYLDPEVKRAMEPYWEKKFGNPSSLHQEGMEARKALNDSRKIIASLIGANPDEIIFTNGGTESDNLAIFGVAGQYQRQPATLTSDVNVAGCRQKAGHIITTKIEHHAVLNSCEDLERRACLPARQGFAVSYLNVSEEGIVDLKELKKSLRKETILVSIMHANNEMGAIQPISEAAKIIRDFKKQNNLADLQPPFFHSDAIQAAGYLDTNVRRLGLDLMSVNGSKIYGPKGVGFLYVKRGLKLLPIIRGGGQERGLRPGTENVAGIVGLAKAFELVQKNREKEAKRVSGLRDYLIRGVLKKIPRSFLNGHPILRLPNNANITISGVEGESLVLYLDAAGIACSTGSACTSQSLEPSHVILALGKPKEDAHCSLRFSLGKRNKKSDIDYLLKVLPEIVKKLRTISAIK